MTSIWFPNNKYPPNTKNYLPCFVLGGGFSIRRKGLLTICFTNLKPHCLAPRRSSSRLASGPRERCRWAADGHGSLDHCGALRRWRRPVAWPLWTLGDFFSRMRSKGSRFTLGVWGLRACSLDVAFASATVRNRPQPSARSPYGRAYGKFCKRGHFWRFHMWLCSVSRGRRALCDIQTWLITRRMSFCVASAILLRRFSQDELQFSSQARHFGHVHRHFAWQAQHFRRAVLRVFCESHCQGYVKWRQGANSVADVMKIDGSLVANLEVHKKTRNRKTSILKLQSVNCKEVSHEMLVLMLPCSSCIFALFRFI